ncbi:outer membrane transport energization protein ExbD [Roseivirga pacifica]|jgi:biopolymer transport protein ExbD|uniref:Outer membrane transport energization protein ExbD n=1 Tax=Roseivirga pacifica TaxID=1267423 RepID=A0A1I0Q5W0_9BACT|nr:biopolymer transporter ExbD [Roseivirga pacifica]MCO6360546.1 biopolymer transporter ExbD [Roseivirga pacifica]MCO6368435.1 biopolymer transporter ExbD [Roseivirga pacifica]MCO6372577.1 biopolymer transporter ExbD [Roseivirga pacifica]MCO6376635.1 biopolymer transporter ExbD [Roseivirga pacifica]MCO6378085.1 biopolymer transporter ExbD [Roseivirga pacifica]
MDIKSKHKVESNFSMSSMTDIVFLLLIFFMLTASFITPSGLPVNLPTAASSSLQMQKNSLTITADLKYYLNDKEVSLNNLERELRALVGDSEGTLSLNIDKSVPTGDFARVGGIAAKLKQKTILVTNPE